jgi:acyl carrier protein
MELTLFIENFENIFFEIEKGTINSNTKFRDIDEWSSLLALSLIALIDETYSIKLTGEDIKNSTTVEDIFNIISKNK